MTSIQRILPRGGTAWQGQHPAPEQSDESKRDPSRRRGNDRPPAQAGTGQIVDQEA
jgi:hypothetical protein